MRCTMFCKVILCTLFLYTNIYFTKSVGISGKLDFGDSHSSSLYTPRLIHEEKKVINIPVHVETSDINKSSDDFDNIGVVCVSGGCNATNVKNDRNDSIQTDVVVHVHAKIDLNQNKTKQFVQDDTPDVPIVVGYGGIDRKSDEITPPQTVIVPNADYSPPILPSTTIDLEPPPINSRSDTFTPNNIYLPPNPENVDIKIKAHIPTITVTMSDNNMVKNVRYKTNGIELKVPYFEPSYNRHYFGEEQPSYVWYSRKQSNFNPVEFRNVQKSAWNPSIWNTRTPIYHRHSPTENSCSCKNQGNHEVTTNLHWYPNANRRISSDDPGSQINDKLAPLN